MLDTFLTDLREDIKSRAKQGTTLYGVSLPPVTAHSNHLTGEVHHIYILYDTSNALVLRFTFLED